MPLGVRFGREPSCVRGRLGVRFGREPKCVRGKTVIPRTNMYNVVLWYASCILGLSAIMCDCDSILRMYPMLGLSATSQEMLSTATLLNVIGVVLYIISKTPLVRYSCTHGCHDQDGCNDQHTSI